MHRRTSQQIWNRMLQSEVNAFVFLTLHMETFSTLRGSIFSHFHSGY